MIEESGLKWSVVESIPVSESIKTGKLDSTKNMTRQNFISNYKQSIINMSKAGLGDIYLPNCLFDWVWTFSWLKTANFIHILIQKRWVSKQEKSQELALSWNSSQQSTWAHKCHSRYSVLQFYACGGLDSNRSGIWI